MHDRFSEAATAGHCHNAGLQAKRGPADRVVMEIVATMKTTVDRVLRFYHLLLLH